MPSLPPIRPRAAVGIDASGRAVLFDPTFLRWLEILVREHEALSARVAVLEASNTVNERRISDLEAGLTIWSAYDP